MEQVLKSPTDGAVTSTDEVDLVEFGLVLRRRWKTVAAFCFGGIVTSAVITSNISRVWQGEFKIVLSTGQSSGQSELSQYSVFQRTASSIFGSTVSSGIETEVEILKSPSVLLPVFEFVKSQQYNSSNGSGNHAFQKWAKRSLKIALSEGTTVLTVQYRDTDKALILPVLDRISKEYKDYSGREKADSLQRAIQYTKEQVDRFKDKSNRSNRLLDTFTMNYGISSSRDGSSIRNEDKVLFELSSINKEIIRRQKLFTDNDPVLKDLLRQRQALNDYYQVTAGATLALPGSVPKTKEQAQEIVLKHNEIKRTALRESETLESLENSLLSLELEKAKRSKPWELISKPTLESFPVSPRRSLNLALGLIAGLLTGGVAALVSDRRDQLVYSEKDVLRLLDKPLISRLSSPHIKIELGLLANRYLSKSSSIALVGLGLNSSNSKLLRVRDLLSECLPHCVVKCTSSLLESNECDHQIIVLQLGSLLKNDLNNFCRQLSLQKGEIVGIIVL